MNVGIIGTGNIANHLSERLGNLGIKTSYMLGSAEANTHKKLLHKYLPYAVFLAISTKDKGEAAKSYIGECLSFGVPVITCEKGALAYFGQQLRKQLALIGPKVILQT